MKQGFGYLGLACFVGVVAVSCGRSVKIVNRNAGGGSGASDDGGAGTTSGGSSVNRGGRPNGGEAGSPAGGSGVGGAAGTGDAGDAGNAGNGGTAGDSGGEGGAAGDGPTPCERECAPPQTCQRVNGFERCVCEPDCVGNGTACDCWGWPDPTTGLTWENPIPQMMHNVYGGATYCNGVVIGGYTDWRLPTIEDLRSLVRGCEATALAGACAVMNDSATTARTSSCNGCGTDGPGINGEYWDPALDPYSTGFATFWSSSVPSNDDSLAWQIDFVSGGRITAEYSGFGAGVICVRP